MFISEFLKFSEGIFLVTTEKHMLKVMGDAVNGIMRTSNCKLSGHRYVFCHGRNHRYNRYV